MGYETRIIDDQLDNRYRNSKNSSQSVIDRVQGWMDDNSALITATPNGAEKAEAVALRNTFIAALRVVIGG